MTEMPHITMEQLKTEFRNFISNNTLNEYLKVSRKGADFALNRKQRKELYIAIHNGDHDWDNYLKPGHKIESHLNSIENMIHEANEQWFMDT